MNPPARAQAKLQNPDECRGIAQPGGARRDRTDDLLLAKQALSQLSYGPVRDRKSEISNQNSF
jgi:hypothetical protein